MSFAPAGREALPGDDIHQVGGKLALMDLSHGGSQLGPVALGQTSVCPHATFHKGKQAEDEVLQRDPRGSGDREKRHQHMGNASFVEVEGNEEAGGLKRWRALTFRK